MPIDAIEGTIVEAVDLQHQSHPVWSHALRVRAAPPRWTRPTAPARRLGELLTRARVPGYSGWLSSMRLPDGSRTKAW